MSRSAVPRRRTPPAAFMSRRLARALFRSSSASLSLLTRPGNAAGGGHVPRSGPLPRHGARCQLRWERHAERALGGLQAGELQHGCTGRHALGSLSPCIHSLVVVS